MANCIQDTFRSAVSLESAIDDPEAVFVRRDSQLMGKTPHMGDCLLAELRPDSSMQGGKVSGSLAVMLHGITFANEPDTGGRVSGPLNEAPSILSGVPSKTCLPCLGTRPRSLFLHSARCSFKKKKQ